MIETPSPYTSSGSKVEYLERSGQFTEYEWLSCLGSRGRRGGHGAYDAHSVWGIHGTEECF